MRLTKIIVSVLILILQTSYAMGYVVVEDYGQLPEIRSVSISPNGEHYGYIQERDGEVNFNVVNIPKSELVVTLSVKRTNANSIYFATNEHVILSRSDTNYYGRTYTTSFVYNIKTSKLKRLLSGFNNVNIGKNSQALVTNHKEKVVYVSAFIGVGNAASNLLKVNLETGKGDKKAKGSPYTIDWFLDVDGNVLAREDYNDRTKEHSIFSYNSGKWVKIFTQKTKLIEMYIAAVSADKKNLLFTQDNDSTKAVFSMALADGAISEPKFVQEGTDVVRILKNDHNQEFKGILYSGLLPNFQYVDDELQSYIASIQSTFPTSGVRPVSFTPDDKLIVVKISGNEGASQYAIFNTVTSGLKLIGSSYPQVNSADIANIKAIRYKSSDGTPITAVVTWPKEAKEKKNLPLIVYPHGGPENFNTLEFNWLAQYFSRKGYLVLQPNFRGSSGFGTPFRDAGRGKWGKEMQEDISEGVRSLIKNGSVDPERVCIMGIGYGGYAALAGGAFTADLYKCVVSVEGISDLHKFMDNHKQNYGRDSATYNYWKKSVGDLETESEKLKNRSPVNFADNFKAPVLLVYEQENSSSTTTQSKRMQKALKKANKENELVVLTGGGHWETDSKIRLELLQKISDFIEKHNPVNSEN